MSAVARSLLVAVLAVLAVALVGAAQPAAASVVPDRVVPVEGERSGPVRSVPSIPEIGVDTAPGQEQGLSRSVSIALLVGASALIPALVLLMTSFTRFVVVLGLAKQALALQTVPPSQVLIGLSLFLTTFVMAPVFQQMHVDAIEPYTAGRIDGVTAVERGFEPLRAFMLAQTRDEDLALFVSLSDQPAPAAREEVPATTLIPAFVISELRTAFVIGFVIFIPFLLIDLVVAAILMSMGMVMVPPVFISLPLKLLLFVLVDGWVLMIGSMVQSVQQAGLG